MPWYAVSPIALTGDGWDWVITAVAVIGVSIWWHAERRTRAARRELAKRRELWPLRTWGHE